MTAGYAFFCVLLSACSSEYASYGAPGVARSMVYADNDAVYVPPRGYGVYADNDAGYVPPRGYGAYADNDAYYRPYRGNPNPGYAYAPPSERPRDELEQWDFQ